MPPMPIPDPLSDTTGGSHPPSHLHDDTEGYDRLEMAEAIGVLSHYDLGVVSAVQEFRRGSRRSPKLLLKCERGLLILKRLAPGRDLPERVSFSESVQEALVAAAYPIARVMPTRRGERHLRLEGRVYNLFECVAGQLFDGSAEAAQDAGAWLGRFHRALASANLTLPEPGATFHRLPEIERKIAKIPVRCSAPELETVCASMIAAYRSAADHVDAAGFQAWPLQIVHGDWHPGNLLFRGSKVVAVIDFETTRVARRAVDIANGALQFTLTRSGLDPEEWPESLDESRLRRFCLGYDSQAGTLISTGELEALPWLMIEAIITESAIPISATGRFGRIPAAPFLMMIERKVRWLTANAARLTRLVS